MCLFLLIVRELGVAKLDFEGTLLRAVDCGLLALGETPKKAIYYHLKRKFQLKKEDIPEEPGEFARALNGIFGPGAEIIQEFILRELCDRLNLNFQEKKGFEFADYVKQAQESVIDKKQSLVKAEK